MNWLSRLNRKQVAAQRGFGFIGMVAILAALAAVAAVAYLSSQTYQRQRQATDQAIALNWADSLLKSYMLEHGRLPCPASKQLGAEDCASTSASWLPTQTLMNSVAVSDASVTAAMRQMNYQPYRGDGRLGTPNLMAQPNKEYVPAVGEIVLANNAVLAQQAAQVRTAAGILGTQHSAGTSGQPAPGPSPMSNYASGSAPGTMDFCQKLQNLTLGSSGARAIESLQLGTGNVQGVAGPNFPFNPWASSQGTARAYMLKSGDGAQSSAVLTSALSEALQCEIVHASLDVLASAAALSEPGGTVLGTQKALLNGNSGWVDDEPAQTGGPGWGSFEWMTQVLIPQIIAADWVFDGVRVAQTVLTVTKQARDATTMPIYALFNPVWFGREASADPLYAEAFARRLLDLGAQTVASANDTAYQFLYQGLVDQLQAMRPWGSPIDQKAPLPVSDADRVVQQAVSIGLASGKGAVAPP